MKNWKQLPKNDQVSKYIECYWFLEKERHDTSHNYPILNPDPSAHLIISTSAQPYQYEHGAISHQGIGSHCIFPHLTTFSINHTNPFKIIGIKFRVGALYSLNFNNPRDNLNTVINFKRLSVFESLITSHRLLNMSDDSEKVRDQLDEIVISLLSKVYEDKHSELVRQVLPILIEQPINQIGERLHCSQRTVERSFTKVTGLTMKQVCSMIRLEEILSYLYKYSSGHIDWADIANKFDFSDQPHLIRHFRNTINKTPGTYSRDRDLTIDVYGNFELE